MNKALQSEIDSLMPQQAFDRPSYREAEAKDGWQRMIDWFRQHGV